MSRIYTFVAIGIVIVVAVYSRRLAIQLLGPGSQMMAMVLGIQFGGINGQEVALDIYRATTVYVPWLLVAAAVLGGVYKEFLQTNVTRR